MRAGDPTTPRSSGEQDDQACHICSVREEDPPRSDAVMKSACKSESAPAVVASASARRAARTAERQQVAERKSGERRERNAWNTPHFLMSVECPPHRQQVKAK